LLRLFCLFFVLSQPFAFIVEVKAQPQLVASVKPLQLIAAAITDGVSIPGLVIGTGQDPHHPSLRPSERRALAEADLTLWVGPILELPLEDTLDISSAQVITAYALLEAAGLTITNSLDPHVWLSTQNARLIAQVVTRRLQAMDSMNQARYANNLNRFLLALDELDAEITTMFSGLSIKDFAVYHNAFQYFERQFGLQHVASFTENEELQPGVRRVLQIRESLEAAQVNCLLIQPQNNPQQLTQMLGRPMHMVSVDVLGFDYPLNASAYIDFMRDLSNNIAGCLHA
jgi:zinc transport system substrate-binding protein